ncbi:MAG: hypothetical protein EOO39_50700 [Cytophagaceae bacterium]|nr:MAG: hypothetical protein EOO39_50700 [Cytophagaceae bacterium]
MSTRRSPFLRAGIASTVVIATLAAATLASSARAAVVYSGLINLAVPNTNSGLYLNLVDGTSYTGPGTFPTYPGTGSNFDINLYGVNTWSLFAPGISGQVSTVPANLKGFVSASAGGPTSNISSGTVIGASSLYTTASSTANLTSASEAIIGVRFRNETGDIATPYYGYVRVSLTNGQPGVIKDYAYESVAGQSIVAGATGVTVPEPGTLALILPGMAGIAGLVIRRIRGCRR